MSVSRADLRELGFEWVVVRGIMRARPLLDEPPFPSREITNVHDLRACLSCPARMDEPCVTRRGKTSRNPHAGRLVRRVCSCGAQLAWAHAARCPACAYERHRAQDREWRRRQRAGVLSTTGSEAA